jgi:hypothetical protein
MALKKKHGGKRKGAGRKPGFKMKKSLLKESTKTMRIPKGLVSHVKDLIKQYKKFKKNPNDDLSLP